MESKRHTEVLPQRVDPPGEQATVGLPDGGGGLPGSTASDAVDLTAHRRQESEEQRAPSSREAILEAARSLAMDVGFRRATIVDVARRAGVSRMTVYREFDDLGSIWSDLLTRELVGMIDGVAGDLLGADARERLVRAAGALARGISHHPLFRRALEVDPEVLLPLVVDRFGSSQQAALEHIEALLSVGVLAGSIKAERATASAACAVLLTIQSFIFSARVIESRGDAEDVIAELGELLDGYLAP